MRGAVVVDIRVDYPTMSTRPQDGPQLLSPSEAGKILDLSKPRVLQLLNSGQLLATKDDGGRWQIPIAHVEELKERREQEAAKRGAHPHPQDAPTPELVAALRDQVRMLEGELKDWKEEALRKDHIIMSLTQRIPELEANETRQKAPGSPESTGPSSTPPEDHGGREKRSSRPWWRRIVGS